MRPWVFFSGMSAILTLHRILNGHFDEGRISKNAEDISVAASRAKGMQYDGEKEVEAY